MKIKAVDHFFFIVTDRERALAFYRDTLGLQLDGVYHEGAWAEFSIGSVTLALYGPLGSKPAEPGYSGGATVALAVDDVSASVAELRSKGVTVLDGPFEGEVCHMATITDPDGNRLWLHQRKDGTCG